MFPPHTREEVANASSDDFFPSHLTHGYISMGDDDVFLDSSPLAHCSHFGVGLENAVVDRGVIVGVPSLVGL